MSNNHEIYKDHPVYKRLMKSGPKRILSLDGGGIRGALSLGYLEKIETILREKYGRPDFVLSDYFDLVGGTSTGSIIATLISLGNSVSEIKRIYFNLGEKIFTKRKHILNWGYFKYLLSAEYDHSFLEKELEEYLGELTLGSEELRTGLAIFTKRADTFSIWNFHNHPVNAYYEDNKGLHLKDLIRASTAAPSYFEPKEIKFKGGESAIFVDGGMSMVNNPSLMLFLMVTISGYGYEWKKGESNIQLISVGTGSSYQKVDGAKKTKLKKRKSVFWAANLSDIFMIDANEQNKFLLQYFSNPKVPEIINSEAKDLSGDLITNQALLDYCRYNIHIDQVKLNELNINKTQEEVENLRKMDQGKNVKQLFDIGKKDAERKILPNHFNSVFDIGIVEANSKILSKEEAEKLFIPLISKENILYKKIKHVLARKAKDNEEITSITSDGIETTNQASIGDYIVKNQTGIEEEYIVKADRFPQLYEHIKNVDSKWKKYSPRGKVYGIELTLELLEVNELPPHFHIIAIWGKAQYVSSGDYIVQAEGEQGVYRIGRKEFEETYMKT